ncbi:MULTISPECIES: D-alanyl-D-alanine carboxypeptidase family protein [unclassified Modicisalibacter]|uniref:D-alanyl-D-alanine carboxypeptidase family protein n=1 Tax=unclassified Modicisalibacter TaxID=2679913 RepID=UPI001CCCBD41|nr:MULTISPECIES: D-alanyl-D-alanine carboxypeptidase family protein [unclassified Modicisalibacter]MBZ9560343.1 D-alanyl-D-alanine carboxypeptidase [Modicisalibacter sp. R2A 31.J]MBZ9576252.1 D-alanyl-D-alanine carboxypeptidase [Modicisalibacter sp. MOD 31.J]
MRLSTLSSRSWQGLAAAVTTLCIALVQPAMAEDQQASQPKPDSSMQQSLPEPMIPSPPSLNASSWILLDANSGEVLVEHNADQRLPPASLTKMMTAYIVEKEINDGNIADDDMVTISEHAWRTGGSRMFVREGTQVSVNDLLHGVVIQSGNDASVALAEYVAGSEPSFVDLMNQQAQRMGLKNTHFANATGLPHDDHYSSARDLANIARHIIQDFPDHYEMYSEKYFTYNGIRQPNRNRLLWRDPSVDGLKTGHTDAAGFCLVSSAKQDDMRLISVVMGTNSDEARAQESQKLLSYGFRFFDTFKLYQRGAVLNQPRIWGGAQDTLKLGVTDALYLTVPKGRRDEMTAKLNIPETIKAPVQAGQQLGTLQVKLGDEVIREEPLVALQSVEQGGFFKRIWDAVLLFFTGLF